MSTRAGGINNALDFQKYFGTSLAFIGENFKIKVSDNAYPQNDENFFYLRYQWAAEQINKKLTYRADTLILNKEELLKVDGKKISKEETSDYYLYYYNASKQSSEQITVVDLVMMSLEDLDALLTSMKASDLSLDKDAVAAMVTELYGRCQPGNLAEAMKALNK